MAQHAQTLSQSVGSQTLAQQGDIYRQAGCFEAAIDHLTRALELEPSYAWALANRAESYSQIQQYDKALEDFSRAIELKADYPWALAHRGVLYRQLRTYEKALADLNRAIELKPDYLWALTHRGSTRTILRRYEDALADLDRVIALDPTRISSAAGERGLLLNYLGYYAETIASCRQGLEKDPEDYEALYSLSVAQARGQGLTMAQQSLEKTWAQLSSRLQRPLLTPATRAALLYRQGGLAALQGQMLEALRHLEEAISLDREPGEMARHDPAWLDLRGNARFQSLIADV